MERMVKFMSRADREESMLDAALLLCQERCFQSVHRLDIAHAAGCSVALVHNYLGKDYEIHTRIVEHAIKRGHPQTLLQALAVGHPAVASLDSVTKKKLARWVAPY